MGFWDRVKSEIKSQNTTQEWVATKAGQKLRTFQGWISREIMPNADQAQAIASALGVTVEYLVTGTDSTDPWMREHFHLIEDLKTLTTEALEDQEAAIHAIAERRRRELGKSQASG
jgi:transcriptional regulator with XRE-family HTH domain